MNQLVVVHGVVTPSDCKLCGKQVVTWFGQESVDERLNINYMLRGPKAVHHRSTLRTL
jgi:hypothetical protein